MKYFVNSGHWNKDSGYVHGSYNERDLCFKIRNKVKELFPSALFVPDDLNLAESIKWVNDRAVQGDIGVDIHLNSNSSTFAKGTSVYHYKEADKAKKLSSLVAAKLGTTDKGAISDTESYLGELGWCRKLKCPGLVLETCFLTNPSDRERIITEDGQTKVAKAIVEFFKPVDPATEDDADRLKAQALSKRYGFPWQFLLDILRENKII